MHRQHVASVNEVLNHRCESSSETCSRLMETAPGDSAAAPLLGLTSQRVKAPIIALHASIY